MSHSLLKYHAKLAAVASLMGVALTLPVAAQQHNHGLTRLGTVMFPVDCADAVQPDFNRAMALYHSFAWPEAAAAFAAIVTKDPSCGMAHWGSAITILENPFTWPAALSPQKLNRVAAALDSARAAGLKTQRERDYVEALAVFVRDHDKLSNATRLQSLDSAMATLAARYPDDKEASILSALMTSANFNPADKTYANQMKAAQILEPLFHSNPDHPGVAHYLIHSYDYPPIAKFGVTAARKYATIAPDASHALHMPSHIFTRLGYWHESIEANQASVKSDGDATTSSPHGYDYMVYAHLQLAQDSAAREAMKHSLAAKPIDGFAGAFAYAAMPARVALEQGDWSLAANLPLQPSADAYPWHKHPQAEASNAFARGIGAARIGDAAAARVQQARLIALRDAAKEAKLSYWAGQIDIQAAVVGALALCAEGKQTDCISALHEAASREDATEKHVVTPGPLLPAREILAEILLIQNQAGEALVEYEAVLVKEPNRYRAMAGAMDAAKQVGDQSKARAFASALLKQASNADAPRASLDQAKALVDG
jgi:hypothetical protein